MKKIIYSISVLALSAVAVVSLCSFTSNLDAESSTCSDASCEGKHCRYTVGCSCPGFEPIQHEEVYKLSYCRNCGHHKQYHR